MKKTELICYIAFCTTFLFSRMFFSSSLFIDFCIEHTFAVSLILSFVLSLLVLCLLFIVKYATELRKYHKSEK